MGRTKGSRNKKTESPEYWEELLCKQGLSVEAGRSKRISYVGGVQTLDFIAGLAEMGTRDTEGDLDISYPVRNTSEGAADNE